MNTRSTSFSISGLVIILVLVALFLAGIGITNAAAQNAIPGDALYPVKTSLEQTRLSLARDAGDRAQMKMTHAEQRMTEIAALIEEGRYREINAAVLAFEADINGAILELETLAQVDPARSARISMEITRALTRYAQTLSVLAASAPEIVRGEVNRALTSTHTASGLDLPDDNLNTNDNENDNTNSNTNQNSNSNENSNDNGNINDDDNLNTNENSNANTNSGQDDNGNTNTNGSTDDNSNANTNSSTNDSSNTNTNSSVDDSSNTNTNSDDGLNDNSNLNDNANDNGSDDSGNDDNDNGNENGDDSGGNRGKGDD